MTIKCALCGEEYENVDDGPVEQFYHKMRGNCHLGHMPFLSRNTAEHLNAAIEAARKMGNSFSWTQKITDPRKPEECKYRHGIPYGTGHQCQGPSSHFMCDRICPCAAWEKKA